MTMCLPTAFGSEEKMQLFAPVWQSDTKPLNDARIRKDGITGAQSSGGIFSGRKRDDTLSCDRSSTGGFGKP